MSEAARYRGLRDVSFTPDGGSAVPFADVESIDATVSVDQLEDWGADDIYTTVSDITHIAHTWSLKTRDVDAAESLTVGNLGTLTFTRVGRGSETDKVVSMQVRVIQAPKGVGASKGAWSEAEVMFQYVSTDGSTGPTVA